MKMTPLLISALLPAAMGLKTHMSLSLASEAQGQSPVKRVVDLLKDMTKQLEADGEEDEKTYEKLECWCTETTKEKTGAIEAASTRIGQLTTAIETGIAEAARLGPEIKALKAEQEENDESMKQATAIRDEQIKAYTKEKKDLKASITALGQAVIAMNKKADAKKDDKKKDDDKKDDDEDKEEEFLQVQQKPIGTILQQSLGDSPRVLEQVVETVNRRGLDSFLQGQQTLRGFDEIKGILSQMKENMVEDLKTLETEEKANEANHKKLVEAKKEEYATGNAQVQAKQTQKAAVDQKLVENKADKTDTTKAKDADTKFLANVKKQCDSADDDWAERQKVRAEETKAVNKAIEMLDSDEARKTFAKVADSFLQMASASKKANSFLQMASTSKKAGVNRAMVRKLSSMAAKTGNPKLALMALELNTQAKLDGVAAVVKSVEDMVKALRAEKAEETKKRNQCVEDIDKNKADTKKLVGEKDALDVELTDLAGTKKELTDDSEEIKAAVKKVNEELAKAGQEREEQNKVFQQGVTDQRETQKLLQGTLTVLKNYYDKEEKKEDFFIQTGEPDGQFVQTSADADSDEDAGAKPKPQGLRTYKKAGGGKGVLAMLDAVLADSKKSEAENIKSEADAQTAYEKLVKDTNAVVKAKAAELTAKAAALAAADTAIAAKTKAKTGKVDEIKDAQEAGATIATRCTFLLKNYQARQTAFDDEVSALTEAKGYLSSATGDSPKKAEKKDDDKKEDDKEEDKEDEDDE